MTVTSHHQGPPSVRVIQDQIARAIQLMATMDLNPKYPGRKRGNYVPGQYQGPGEPPLRFDQDQGWEVPTTQGRKLDQAIRQVGASIEARAMHTHRHSSVLSLKQITNQRRELRQEGQDVLGKLWKKTPDTSDALANALTVLGGRALFTSEKQYRDHATQARTHVEDRLKLDEDPGHRMNHEEYAAYNSHLDELKAEEERFSSDNEAQSAWARNEAKLDSEARLRALAEVRPMGGQFNDDFFTSGEPRNKRHGPIQESWLRRGTVETLSQGDEAVGRIVRGIGKVLPKDWVDQANEGTLEVRLGTDVKGGTSAWLKPQDIKGGGTRKTPPRLTLHVVQKNIQGPMSGWASDALHEMGHHFEHAYPEINQIARTHKAIRTMNSNGTLHPIEPIPNFPPPEGKVAPERMDTWDGEGDWCRPGTFASPYTGKESHPWGSEVFSTGIESAIGGRYGALRGHGGYKSDPEHANLTLGLLATVGRR